MQSQKTIGIIGGGQLGRMLTLAAKPLGFNVLVVDPSEHSPASQVGAKEITANLYDPAALKQLAEQSDFITIEIEHLDVNILDEIAKLGKPVNPAPATIRIIQDKFKQKEFLAAADVPVAPFAEITDYAQASKLLKDWGGKMLVKTRFGAYDGRGNMVVASPKELKLALEHFKDSQLYAEKFVPFRKELAIMVARGMNGEVVLYPVVETIHQRNICLEVLVPAPISEIERSKAEKAARQVAELLQGAGMFGIEMFLTIDGDVMINEIAPRVHNSGHYTQDASRTSQFEQHIRAISGLPLGSTDMTVPAAAMVNILGEHNRPTTLDGLEKSLAVPQVSVHLYGKSPTKIDRKMGHINATGATVDEALERGREARKHLEI